MDREAWWAAVHGVKESGMTEWLTLTYLLIFSSVQSLSRVQLFAISWTAVCQASLSITNSQCLLKLMSIELMMPSNHLILYHSLLLPSIFPSIRIFLNESVFRIRCPKYWRFSYSISPSSEYSALISFRIDWLYLLAVQGTLKSLLQHHSSKASVLQCSAFYSPTLTSIHDYWKTLNAFNINFVPGTFEMWELRVTQIKILFIFTLVQKENTAHVTKWGEKIACKNTRYTFLRCQYLKFDNLESSIFKAFLFFSKGEKWK